MAKKNKPEKKPRAKQILTAEHKAKLSAAASRRGKKDQSASKLARQTAGTVTALALAGPRSMTYHPPGESTIAFDVAEAIGLPPGETRALPPGATRRVRPVPPPAPDRGPSNGPAAGDDLSLQARKILATLQVTREEMAAKVEELTGKVKVLKETADMIVVERDKLMAATRNKGTICPSREDTANIKALSETRAKTIVEMSDLKGQRKVARAAIADALAETDRVIAAESPDGTIFAKPTE